MPLGSSSDDALSTEAFFPLVYEELKRIARQQLRAGGARATLSTTELVHEVFLRLSDTGIPDWEGRAHFFGAASRAMRRVLVDFARRRTTAKRGGRWSRVSLGEAEATLQVELGEILAVNDALEELDALDPRLRRVVELRFFGGVSEHELAAMLGVSVRTVERDWLKARMFLLRELELGRPPTPDAAA